MARPSVVTCQALALLGSREAGCARNARGWILSGEACRVQKFLIPGMSFRMALDLGLHLDSQRLVELGYLGEDEYNMRAITFWGCFIFDRYDISRDVLIQQWLVNIYGATHCHSM